MRRFLGYLCMVVMTMITAARGADDEMIARAERAAAELPWLSLGDVLYDRDPMTGPDRQKVADLMRQFRDSSLDRQTLLPFATTLPLREPTTRPHEDLRALLEHADAKVRTLGIILLFDLNRADVLADIAALVNDPSITFPEPAPRSFSIHNFEQRPWPMQERTVGHYARAPIDCWVSASWELSEMKGRGQLSYNDPPKLVDRLREFAAARDPQHSTAGLRVAMQRATGGISPLQADRMARVQQVLMKLQQVPMPRRFFVALALDFDRFRDERFSPSYLLDLARQVPREMRIASIERRRALDDPDLEPGFGYGYFLDHAADLFRASDAEFILKVQPTRSATQPDQWTDARYVVAAAMLRPQRADEILIPAFDRFANEYYRDHRTRIAIALVEIGSYDKGLPAAIDWFFRETPQPGSFGFGREMFLERLRSSDPVRYRNVVAKIARDDRLRMLGPASTRILLTSIEGYLGRRLADEQQIYDSYGIDEAQRDRKFEPLREWQRAIQQTVDEWDR